MGIYNPLQDLPDLMVGIGLNHEPLLRQERLK
jgi:hypothetical protein